LAARSRRQAGDHPDAAETVSIAIADVRSL